MNKTNHFIIPGPSIHSFRRFLSDEYGIENPKLPSCLELAKAGKMKQEEIPKSMPSHLFKKDTLPKKYAFNDPDHMFVFFNEDPAFETKLETWWFGDKHRAYIAETNNMLRESILGEGRLSMEEVNNMPFQSEIDGSVKYADGRWVPWHGSANGQN